MYWWEMPNSGLSGNQSKTGLWKNSYRPIFLRLHQLNLSEAEEEVFIASQIFTKTFGTELDDDCQYSVTSPA